MQEENPKQNLKLATLKTRQYKDKQRNILPIIYGRTQKSKGKVKEAKRRSWEENYRKIN